jgi:prevent-host-death family protein
MQFNIHEAKTQFSKIVERALAGEEVIIAKNGHPVLVLQPISGKKSRIPGLSVGKGTISEDFDSPLNDDILTEFEK